MKNRGDRKRGKERKGKERKGKKRKKRKEFWGTTKRIRSLRLGY